MTDHQVLLCLVVTATSLNKTILSTIPSDQLALSREESTSGSGIYDAANCTFNIANVGIPDQVNSPLMLEVAMLVVPGATEGDTYTLGVTINDKTEQTATFTVGPPEDYLVRQTTLLTVI